MSVTINWRPTNTKDKHFDGGTSSSLQVLKQTFGQHIGPGDVAALRAMARAANDEFYNEVADTIEHVGEIEIWGSH